jgi:hypothetical protein
MASLGLTFFFIVVDKQSHIDFVLIPRTIVFTWNFFQESGMGQE